MKDVVATSGSSDGGELLRFLSQLGHVLIATGEAVAVIEDMLRRIARAHGVPQVIVVAFPTVLFVKLDDGNAAHLDFTSEKGLTLRFEQIEGAFALARDAEALAVTPAAGLVRLRALLGEPPRFGPAACVLGHMLMTVGIALCLKPTLGIVGAAAFFGLVVGILKIVARNRGMLETLLPTAAAFVVAALVLMMVKYGVVASPLRVLIASLVTFLPGGILAVATMDLAYADMVSGASRFVTGLVQLLFLVLGMTIAASLVGLPPEQLLVEKANEALVSWALWVGVLCFGAGTLLHYGAAPRALPWMLLVLAVGMAAQRAGNAAFGGYMSGFVGALVVTPVCYLIQYRLRGPAAMITFLPALWLLVPGSLGLIGLAELAGDDHLAGVENFSTTLFSIAAIALGSLTGSGIYNALFDPVFRHADSMAETVRRRLSR
ncbi:MAG: threonine/serine exporter family protein [Casimicrobiaceae bacterium]